MRTAVAVAPVDVQPALEEGEAVAVPGGGRGAGHGDGEVGPADAGGVVHVQVVEQACAAEGGVRFSEGGLSIDTDLDID